MKQFKIRCSSIGQLMTGTIGLTEVQDKKLQELSTKEKRTALQEEELKKLVYKKEHPELPQTVITLLQKWWIEQKYDRKNEFYSRPTMKGNQNELLAIEELSNFLKEQLHKNEQLFQDEYIIGTPDIKNELTIDDIKNSYTIFTFPFFDTEIENKDYWWQLQGYMHLTGKKKARLIYCLTDASDDLVERETTSRMWIAAKENGITPEELELEVVKQIANRTRKQMTFSDIPRSERFKIFEIDYDPQAIEKVIERVKLCRKYINKNFVNEINKEQLLQTL